MSTFRVAVHLAPTARLIIGTKSQLLSLYSSVLNTHFDSEHNHKFEYYSNSIHTTLQSFENKVSRNMTSIRGDLIQDVAASNCKPGQTQITVLVESEQDARIAGLALARNWPIYNRKASPKVYEISVDFQSAAKLNIDMAELNVLAQGVRQTQDLMDRPCAELRVSNFVTEARQLVARLDSKQVSIKIIQGVELNEQGFGGLWGVGKGASSDLPALVILSYTPEKVEKTVALVGKGIVYDTGGLSIKPTNGMCGMKHDMGGAAVVFSAFESIVKQKLNHKVYALLCLAENAVGPESFRNDDILLMHSGKTVEINNTDAEGRLVLGDGVSYASKVLQVDSIINVATLTGAQMIVTGVKHAGVVTALESTEQAVIKAGKETGDLVFPMIYAPQILMEQFDSKVADLKNSVKDRLIPSSSCAAHFVEAHLAKEYKGEWLHVDIAGPGSSKERGTGFGVALLYQLVKNMK